MSSRRRDNFKLTFLIKDSGLCPLSFYKPFKSFSYRFNTFLFLILDELCCIYSNSISVIYNITFFYYSFLKIKMSVIYFTRQFYSLQHFPVLKLGCPNDENRRCEVSRLFLLCTQRQMPTHRTLQVQGEDEVTTKGTDKSEQWVGIREEETEAERIHRRLGRVLSPC